MSSPPESPRIRVFGGIALDGADGPIGIGGPRQRRLVALLAARAGSVVTVDWLAEYLWADGDRPEASTPAIRTYMSRLRQALPAASEGWLETESSGYRLAAPPETLEHLRFGLLRKRARQARDRDDPQAALVLLDEALALWRGEPFRELEDLDWARADVEQLRLDRLEMQEERWEAALALGRHTQITGELAAFTAEHGLRDRAARQFALALYRSGRTTEALRVVDQHRNQLAEESGLEPSKALLELESAMLSGDPALDVDEGGRPLRGYRLMQEVGNGAFSIVWRAIQPSVEREVAIKVIRAELATQPEFIRRFEAEAHMVARIEHPHIVPLIDYWRDPDSAYLVMRWLGGGTLERRLDEGSLGLTETLTLARQIGAALSAAHAAGVVHRDVKTSNIMFDEAGNAFLTDFGIALEAAKSSGPEAALSPGSPAYSSPEQIRQEELGPGSDVFSLGVVLFECLTGHLPLARGAGEVDLLDQQLRADFPDLSEVRSDVPRPISDAIRTATAGDPVERFASMTEFVSALEAGESGAPAVRTATVPAEAVVNPYKGLRAFDSVDARTFFGRERLVSELTNRLSGDSVRSRCLVVVGPSGSGKSSVVRAGLIPALRSGAVDGSEDWYTTTLVPGSDPYESLEAALLRVAVNPPPSLLDQLRDGPRGVLRSVRRCLGSDHDRVVIVIDQFEEIFTSGSADDARRMLDALAAAVTDPSTPLRLVATLRADYYDRPLNHPAFAPILKETAVDVTPLAADELERAIVEPARCVGVEFERGLPVRIAAETVGQPSPLPLLQYTLSELFEHRSVDGHLTTAAYAEIGGLSGALARRAESIYEDASDEERRAIRTVFGRLADPAAESADLRRRARVADFADDPSSAAVVDKFGAARLLTFDRDTATREPTVEVAHEALLREWPRLVTWLREDADVLRSIARVAASADAWDEGGRAPTDLYRGDRLGGALDLAITAPRRLRALDLEFIDRSRTATDDARRAERNRVRRLRRLVAGTALALVVALLAGAVALSQRDDARRATRDAELATLISRSAASARENPDLALLLALEAHRRSPGAATEQAVLNALGSSAIPNRVATYPPMPAIPECGTQLDARLLTAFGVDEARRLISLDVTSGQVADHGEAPAPCVRWWGDASADRRLVSAADGRSRWIGAFDGPLTRQQDFDAPTHPWLHSWRSDRLLSLVFEANGPPSLRLDELESGAPVVGPISEGDPQSAALSADGELVALGFATPGRPAGEGLVIVLDTEDGAERFRVDSVFPAALMTIDETNDELVAAMFGGTVMTVDLASGDIVADVRTTTRSGFFDVAVDADGLLIVTSEGQIELVDRREGPVGEPIELRNVLDAKVLPDGTVYTVAAPGERIEIVALQGNGLIEQAWDVEPFAEVGFNDGYVGWVGLPGGQPVTVDLETGVRSVAEPLAPDGSPVQLVKSYPESDGVVGIDVDDGIGRWVGDQLVERMQIRGQAFTGTRMDDLWAVLSHTVGGARASLVDVGRDRMGLVFAVDAPDAATVHPSREGGMHVLNSDGTLATYDGAGDLSSTVQTGVQDVQVITLDPATGRLAIVSQQEGGVTIVDPADGGVHSVPTVEAVANLGFGRDGELLAITGFDGTVRLWDLANDESAGLVWDGNGAIVGSPSWYDERTRTMWVYSSGQVLAVPLDPQQWIERACELAGRELTPAEWDRFVPGNEPRTSACS